MDFVPVHFAIDEFALANYDGTPLYEYPYEDIAMSQWGSKNFIHSRGEVKSFLQSAANYWIEEYHFDGLRVDALSNIIYWQGNSDRGENKGAIEFIKGMNKGLKELHPTVILAAEDSTAYPKVTEKVEDGGLGFDYKWDMGWMNDTLEYFKMHPYDRKRAYHKLTFSMMYFYSEHFLMPLSHDEVVHGKATIIQKMHGEYGDKFKQVRALYMYMYAHPGKKLNFMGNEIAQFREWDEKREQDWSILDYPMHNNFYKFMKKLNNIYLEYPALYENDYKHSGFKWIDCHQEDRCIYVFERICSEQRIIAIFNFSNEYQKNYELKVDSIKKMRLIIDSNSDDLEANEVIYIVRANNRSDKVKENKSEEEIENTILIDIPAFSARYYLVEK